MGPTLLANKYLLLKRIASGGMAEIFLAKQVGLDGFEKLVVVKRILPQFAGQKEYVRMFLDEARTAADLRHPNIVSTFEIDEENGCYFMVMEYLYGLDLRFIFRRLNALKKRMPISVAVTIVMEVCAGLHYAHKKTDLKGHPLGIIHRDVSPQNLVVTFDGETKIVDFGIAQGKHLKEKDPKGVLKGKFGYMSPEQASGHELDRRTDLFSLGIILYELTTGKRLFARQEYEDPLALLAKCEIEPPSHVDPAYPSSLEAIVMKALAKELEMRFADCDSLRKALLEFLHEQKARGSRDDVATFMRENFKDEQEHKSDAILSGVDQAHLHTSYLARNTQSMASEFTRSPKPVKWSVVSLGVVVVVMIGLLAGIAVYFMTLKPAPKSELVFAALDVPKPIEPQPQEVQLNMGEPSFEEKPSMAQRTPEKKKFGRLKVVVEPWGEIYIDGKLIGITPLAPHKIAEGTHVVRIKNPRLGQDKKLKVMISANRDTLVRHQFE